jgi:cobalamin biosynthesis protein CobD/CbiB
MLKPTGLFGLNLYGDIWLSRQTLKEILKRDLSQTPSAEIKQKASETLDLYINDLIDRIDTIVLK